MRILLTNDDGIDAPGLAVLRHIAADLSDDVWVVAPAREQSGASRALTLHTPLRLKTIAPRVYACSGTPGDSVLLAVRHILSDHAPDLVLSGVNRGQNLADDISISGTVAGALKGTALGIPSIALSQAYPLDDLTDERHLGQIDWQVAQTHGASVIRRCLAQGWPTGVTLNINFPARLCADEEIIAVVPQGQRDGYNLHIDRRTDLRGQDYYWLGFGAAQSQPHTGTDLSAIHNGQIAITPLDVDLTDRVALTALQQMACPV